MMKLRHITRGWQLALLLLLVVGLLIALSQGGYLASKPFAGRLIETYGHFPVRTTPWSLKPRWTIDVSEYGLAVDLKLKDMESTDTPPDWKPHPGWFVFVEDTAAWTYDGDDIVKITVVTPNKILGYGFKTRPHTADSWGDLPNPPKEVFEHLPPNIQAVIREKFPEGR